MERRATRTRTTLAVSMLGVDANRANSGGVKGSEIATPRCRVQSVSRRCRIAPCRVPGPRMARGVGHFGVPRLLSKRRPTDTFMKPIARLVVATVGVALVAPAHAQVDCANWNTKSFFETAEVSDVTQCLQAGADLETRNAGGTTPLHVAAAIGNVKAIAALTAAGAKLEARAEGGLTPMHFAAAIGNAETIEALTAAGADLKARAVSGTTPLHVAAAYGNTDAIAALTAAGADLEARTEGGGTPAAFGGVRRDCRSRDGTTESGCGPEGEEQL